MTELLGTIPGLRLVVLMDAIQSESTEEWAEKIANTPVKQAVVEQFVHEALDPDLLAFILGPKRGQDMVAALRRTYATIREKYPKEMVDVDRVWNEQRTWWKQFPPPGGEPSGSSSSSTQPFSMVYRRYLPFSFVFPTHDDPARVAPRVRRRHLPFAFVLRTPERPLLRRRRSAAERKRRGPAVHRLETTLVSAALLDRIHQFAQETGYSVATVAAGALRLGLTNYLRTTQAKTPPSKRRRGAHRVVTYVSKPLADRVETAALENGRSESEILAGAISCGLGRWRRSQIEGDAPGPSDSSHTHAERS